MSETCRDAIPFECLAIERDPQRYMLPKALFRRSDGITGELTISGTYLQEIDVVTPVEIGDRFLISIAREPSGT